MPGDEANKGTSWWENWTRRTIYSPFEDCFGGISASLDTIFCAWGKRKDEREEKNEGEKREERW